MFKYIKVIVFKGHNGYRKILTRLKGDNIQTNY